MIIIDIIIDWFFESRWIWIVEWAAVFQLFELPAPRWPCLEKKNQFKPTKKKKLKKIRKKMIKKKTITIANSKTTFIVLTFPLFLLTFLL